MGGLSSDSVPGHHDDDGGGDDGDDGDDDDVGDDDNGIGDGGGGGDDDAVVATRGGIPLDRKQLLLRLQETTPNPTISVFVSNFIIYHNFII